MNVNKVKITISGKEYSIQTSEEPSYVQELARQLDQKITDMMNSSDTISLTTAAILVGLGLADDALKTNSDIDNIRTQITTYVEEAAAARLEVDQLNKQLREKDREIDKLKTDLELASLKGRLDNSHGGK